MLDGRNLQRPMMAEGASQFLNVFGEGGRDNLVFVGYALYMLHNKSDTSR